MLIGCNKIGYLISDTKALKIMSLYEILKISKIKKMTGRRKMDKWAKLYQCIESEYNACKRFQKQFEKDKLKEMAKYMHERIKDYEYFLVLMDAIDEEEEGD